jgi:hypothetical protein
MQLPQGSRPVFEVISGHATAPGATLTSIAAAMTGADSPVLKSFPTGHRAFIVTAWSKNQAAGISQIRSQRMHDFVNGFRWRGLTGAPYPYWIDGSLQEVFSQDTLTMEISGSATAGNFEFLNAGIYYTYADGLGQRLITWQEAYSRKIFDVTLEHSITGSTVGAIATSAFTSGTVYNLHANSDYAIIGYHINSACDGVFFKGPDLAQTNVGGPGMDANKEITREYFLDRAKATGLPFVPVINSANAPSTTIGVLCDQAGGTFIVNTILWKLR